MDIQKIIEDAMGDGNVVKRITVNGREIEMNNGKKRKKKYANDDDDPVKCPRCGNIKSGLNNVCPSCEYIFDPEFLKDSIEELRELMAELKGFKKGTDHDYEELSRGIDSQLEIINLHYGKSSEIRIMLDNYTKEKEAIVKKRTSDRRSLKILKYSFMVCSIAGTILYFSLRPDRVPTASEKIGQYIKEKNIGKAKALLPKISSFAEKENFGQAIKKMELDSLISAKDYNGALALVNLEPSVITRDEKIEEILTIEITELIRAKDFDKARQRAQMVDDTYSRDKLKEKIALAEKLNDR